MAIKFDKYDKSGAIHWKTTNRSGFVFNAPLASRYGSVIKRLPGGRLKILDIGCGDGYLACKMAFLRPESSVFGIDSERKGVEWARRYADRFHLKNLDLSVNEGEGLPYGDGVFDVVIMTDVIEHLVTPETVLEEIRRVLSPNGLLIVTTPNRQDGSKWDDRHTHEFDANELKAIIEASIGPTKVFGTWRMGYVRSWKRRLLGRLALDLAARVGVNYFDKEVENPSDDYGQLTAVSRLPNAGH